MLRHIQIATSGILTIASFVRLILSLFLGFDIGAIISSAIVFVCFGTITILSIIKE